MKKTLFILFALLCNAAHAADGEATIGGDNCKIHNPYPRARESVTWSGECKDGFAHGTGTLEWFVRFRLVSHYEGDMQRGRYHGAGYSRQIDGGTQLEGTFANGRLDGYGIEKKVDGSRYEGEWKAGLHEGQGSATYATGGAYSGQWRQGRFHGRGKATYIGGKVVDGEFVNGVPAGQPAPGFNGETRRSTVDLRQALEATPDRPVVAQGASIPFRRAWDALTKPEQRVVLEQFPMLEDGDEPPFPATGTGGIYRGLARAQLIMPTDGVVRMLVTIDKTGAPTQVKVFSSTSPEMAEIASLAVMKEMYKPALCRGNACEMVFPFHFSFSN